MLIKTKEDNNDSTGNWNYHQLPPCSEHVVVVLVVLTDWLWCVGLSGI